MASKTSAGTVYNSIDEYEPDSHGVLVPKGADKAAHNPETVALLKAIGQSDSKALETLRNKDLTRDLEHLVSIFGSGGIDKAQGNLLYELATRIHNSTWLKPHIEMLVAYIRDRKLLTKDQFEGGLAYLKKCEGTAQFDEAAGVGVTVTAEDIAALVAKLIETHNAEIAVNRFRFNITLLKLVREQSKWANPKIAMDEIDRQLLALLGAKTEADLAPAPKAAKKPTEKTVKVVETEKETSVTQSFDSFHAPGKNYESQGYVMTENTMKHMAEHLKITGGQVRTRFPPEPNGILHIGHAKAVYFNFHFAKVRNGITFLRYDDTNPEKEEERFFRGIQEAVAWLGYKPYQITYASDNFQKIYEYAVKMIKLNLAYVCHQAGEELKGYESRQHSPWRNRPIEESLALFEDMRKGKIDEGKATLRLKFIMDDGKIDPVAYRIKFAHHHRTHDDWCIYPTYDFTHPLCDSIEHITHSLCTKEFQNHRSLYYWLCNSLDIYCPVQWEYSRLNMTYTITSKRKIAELIKKGYVNDWDDPRLFTLSSLRRRGFPPKAINQFCERLGVTMAESLLEPNGLESCIRNELNITSYRVMAVLNPIKIIINNIPDTFQQDVVVPNIPLNEAAGTHTVSFNKVIYIDASDFEENPKKGYRRLSATQSVGLKHVGKVITVEKVIKQNENIVEIHATAADLTESNKPQAFIQWVCGPTSTIPPLNVEVRLYDRLFLHATPDDKSVVPNGYLSDLNPNALVVHDFALADRTVEGAAVGTVFQFERLGFFVVDSDTTPKKMVFNRTISLKEDTEKH